jgi:hypothetical protein
MLDTWRRLPVNLMAGLVAALLMLLGGASLAAEPALAQRGLIEPSKVYFSQDSIKEEAEIERSLQSENGKLSSKNRGESIRVRGGPMTLRALQTKAAKVKTRADLATFIGALRADLAKGQWDNSDLDNYLSGLEGITQDIDGAFQNRGEQLPKEPTWGLVAVLLLSAIDYD